jgi:hypothetical protein
MLKNRLRSSIILAIFTIAMFQASLVNQNQNASRHALSESYVGYSWPESYIIINVSDYQGETDGERIQKALNDVPAEGAIVFIPEGVWEACNLTAKSNTIVTGTSGTVLRRPANTTSSFIIFDNQANFAVANLTFDGLSISEATGILVINGACFQISNNTFKDVEKHAVYVCGKSVDFTIENNLLINSNVAPILVFGLTGTREMNHFLIASNTLINGTNNGKIGVAFAAYGEIVNNTIIGCTYGIGTRCVSSLVIRNNWIENCSDYGIYLGTQPGDPGSSDIDIANNYIVGSNIGIARYYASGPVLNVSLKNNKIIYSKQVDICMDFQGAFIDNTMTSKEKIKVLIVPEKFVGNVDLNDKFIILADVNNDGKVDMRDIGLIGRLYGSSQGSEMWDPHADIIQDGKIDMRDMGYAAKCFGFHS